MLIAQAKWLPQYAREIPAARKRFRSERKLGTYKGRGGYRVRTRTVSELSKDKAKIRARTVATDKAAADNAERLERAKTKP